jgi:hypothetical protein
MDLKNEFARWLGMVLGPAEVAAVSPIWDSAMAGFILRHCIAEPALMASA